MGLIALLFSVVIDAVWPLRPRMRNVASDEEDQDALGDAAAADPLADVPYDPLVDDAAQRPSSATGTYPAHPLQRFALRLIGWFAGDPDAPLDPAAHRQTTQPQAARRPAAHRQLSAPGWLAVVGIPVMVVAALQVLVGVLGGFFVFLLHVAVLYLTVGLGAFHRHFSELQLLGGAGEERSAWRVLARWVATDRGAGGNAGVDPGGGARAGAGAEAGARTGAGVPAAPGSSVGAAAAAVEAAAVQADDTEPLPSRSLTGLATAQAVLAAYRDVFAPLFWYAVLPGAVGPVLYLFARFAACHSYPFARTALQWIDWIPLRLAALGFALAGQFEDTVYCLRAVSPIKVPAEAEAAVDPFLHQRLLLLPVAGGALGLRLSDAAVDARLRTHVPDLDLPGVDPDSSTLQPVAGLLLRSGLVWLGIYLLVKLLD